MLGIKSQDWRLKVPRFVLSTGLVFSAFAVPSGIFAVHSWAALLDLLSVAVAGGASAIDQLYRRMVVGARGSKME